MRQESLPNQPSDPFTPAAARRWRKIPESAQEKILSNVWCGQCLGPVRIILETAQMQERCLILRGQCRNCGKSVCRVVEPENE